MTAESTTPTVWAKVSPECTGYLVALVKWATRGIQRCHTGHLPPPPQCPWSRDTVSNMGVSQRIGATFRFSQSCYVTNMAH